MDRPKTWFRVPHQALQPALLLAIFIADLATPLGVAVWVLYLVPLATTYRAAGQRVSFLVAAGGTALIVLGYFGSRTDIDWRIAAVNRALMVAALWASALFLAWLKESIDAHSSAESRLRVAHRALEASERQLRAILEAEPACVKLMTADGRLLEINRAGLAMLGVDGLDALHGQPLERFVAPGHAERFRAFARQVSEGQPGALEFELIDRRGTRRWLETHAVPFDSPSHGRVVLAVTRDVTEHHRAAQERQRFADVLESSLNEIYIFSAETLRFEYVNAGARRNLGYSQDQLAHMTPLDLKPEFNAASFQKLIGPLLRDEVPRLVFETVHRRADGSLYPVEVHLQLVRHGGQRHFLAVIVDTTERQQAQDALRRNAERLRMALDAAHLCAYEWNIAADSITWTAPRDPAWAIADVDFGGSFQSLMNRIHPRDRPGVEAEIDRCQRQRAPFHREFRIVGPDGGIHWVSNSGEFTHDPHGRPSMMLGVVTDITERKRAEEALSRMAARLESLLRASRSLALARDHDALARDLLSNLGQAIPAADLGAIHLLETASNRAHLAAHAGADSDWLESFERDSSESIVQRVAATRRSMMLQTAVEATVPAGAEQASNCPPGIAGVVCAPLLDANGDVLGTITLGSTRSTFTLEDLTLVEGLAAQAAIAISNTRLYASLRDSRDRLQALSRQLIAAQEQERLHLARELHDQLGQVLAAVTLQLHRARGACGHDATPFLDEALTTVESAIHQVRGMALDLRPPMLDVLGLNAALAALVEKQKGQSGIEIELDTSFQSARLPPALEITCYRLVQEALTNAVRHSRAKRIHVALRQEDHELVLSVEDDGVGFDAAAARQDRATPAGFGLLGMQERVELARGTLEITSSPGRGTIVRARFPLNGAESSKKLPADSMD